LIILTVKHVLKCILKSDCDSINQPKISLYTVDCDFWGSSSWFQLSSGAALQHAVQSVLWHFQPILGVRKNLGFSRLWNVPIRNSFPAAHNNENLKQKLQINREELNSTQLNEHLRTQVIKHLNVHIYLVTISYRYYNQLISRTDLSPNKWISYAFS